ncbi:MAG: flagellar hook-length control protein FliK [Alphaproteobacteria bacterium]
MNSNFLSTENSFQKTLIAPNTANDYSNKRDAFGTNKIEQSDQNKKFAELMNANKKETQNKSNDRTSSKSENNEAEQVDAAKRAFATKQSQTVSSDSILAESLILAEEAGSIDFANVTALHEEIQRLIDAQNSVARSEDGQITIEDQVHDKSTKIESLFSLLASFLNKKDEEQVNELTPQNNSGSDFSTLLGKIQDALESGEIPSLTSGLSIEQLTALEENLEAYIDGKLGEEDAKALEDIAAQWITLSSPPKEQNNNEKRVEVRLTDAPKVTKSPQQTSQDIAPDRHYTQSRYDDRYNTRSSSDGANTVDADSDFKATLKTEGISDAHARMSVPQKTEGAAQRFLQASNALTALPAFDGAPDQQAFGLTQSASQTAMQSSLTNVITQSQSATQPHPATQLVSATIQKAVKAGDDTNIKLRLDPPELGRVEVKMSIDKDNKTKIILTAEKPETFMMLQKDSDVLQRALLESGLDMNGEMSFELASDNHDFNRENSGQNQGRNADDGTNTDDDLITETTMSWHVNPETGHMHYNILV